MFSRGKMNTSEFQFKFISICFSRTIHQNPQNTSKFLDSEAEPASLPVRSTLLRNHCLRTHIGSVEKAVKQNMTKMFYNYPSS